MRVHDESAPTHASIGGHGAKMSESYAGKALGDVLALGAYERVTPASSSEPHNLLSKN